MQASTRWDRALVFALGVATRLPLVLAYPGIHGGDSVGRLARSDTLVLAYQLPLPQLLVYLARAMDPDPVWTRLVFVLIGALVPMALAALVTETAGAQAGRAAGLLLAVHPLFTYYSLVPYQEGPMALFLLSAAWALLRGRAALAGLLVGLACLCRYEAWIAAALAILARRRSPLKALLLFGWAPLLWLLFWRGLSPAGTYVLDLDPAAGRLSRLPFLWGKLVEYSGSALVMLAAAGAAVAGLRRDRRWGWAAAYVLLFLLSIIAAGHEFPPGSGHVSERLIHVPVAALCALAGLAVGAFQGRLSSSRPWFSAAGTVMAALLLAWIGLRSVRRSEALVAEANRDPSLRLAVAVARAVQARLSSGGYLAVAAPPVEPQALEEYVRKVETSGGDATRARALARDLASHSTDLDRIAAQLPRRPRTVIAAGAGEAELVAVYDDAPDAERWRVGPLVTRFEAPPRGVSIRAFPGH